MYVYFDIIFFFFLIKKVFQIFLGGQFFARPPRDQT